MSRPIKALGRQVDDVVLSSVPVPLSSRNISRSLVSPNIAKLTESSIGRVAADARLASYLKPTVPRRRLNKKTTSDLLNENDASAKTTLADISNQLDVVLKPTASAAPPKLKPVAQSQSQFNSSSSGRKRTTTEIPSDINKGSIGKIERLWRNVKGSLKLTAVVAGIPLAGYSCWGWIEDFKRQNSGAFQHRTSSSGLLTSDRIRNFSCGCADPDTGTVDHAFHKQILTAVEESGGICHSSVGLLSGQRPETLACGGWLDPGITSRLNTVLLQTAAPNIPPDRIGRTFVAELPANVVYRCHSEPSTADALVALVHAAGKTVAELLVGVASGVAEGLGLGVFGRILGALAVSATAAFMAYIALKSTSSLTHYITNPVLAAVCFGFLLFVMLLYLFCF